MALLWPVGFGAGTVRADALASGLYVRSDGDHTTVVSPHARVNKRLDATSVDVSYAADVWTSASIDIRASASRPVTEQRDELNLAVSHELTDVTLSAGYRYSVEHDYTSHGANAALSYDFAQNNATLAASGYALFDRVGRAGYSGFSEPLATVGGRLSFTQVFDRQMLGQLTYELTHLDGYQASPYRRVGLGGTGLGCVDAPICLDEHEPSKRNRQAAAAVLRRALSEVFSIGLTYRFVIDDWGLSSHTAALQLNMWVGAASLLSLRYRFYMQSGVNFYRRIYPLDYPRNAYTTRDREQSPMRDQRIGLDWEQKAHVAADFDLLFTTAVGGYLFDYSQFVGLTSVVALEVTFAIAWVR